MEHSTQLHEVIHEELREVYIQKEPVRDWSFGFITGHRLRVVIYLILGMAVLYGLQVWIWPLSREPRTFWEHAWSWGSLLWLACLPATSIGLVGMLMYRHATPETFDMQPIDQFVCIRIVSRGTNIDALTETIRRCQKEMTATPLFHYVIEVVTDTIKPVFAPPHDDVRFISVPEEYKTQKGTRYKARALQYACEHSPLPDDAWIIHLDEETQITSSGVKGIARMIQEEESSGKLRIGQGAILYHRKWKEHPFLTLADNVRTGDDFARFYFGHRLGITVFGLHGSFIVTRNDIEKSIGFDFGPRGSITEDAFWALMAMQRGHRCRWVDGYLEEQSTQGFWDFVMQRRRWFQGLALVALYAPVKLRWRLTIGINTVMWSITPIALVYTFLNLLFGVSTTPWIHLLANFSFVFYIVLYLIGLKANMDEHGIRNKWQRFGWNVAQILCALPFGFMEAFGAGIAILKPYNTPGQAFHVVKK